MKIKHLVCLFVFSLLAYLLTGCAHMNNGSKYQIPVTSSPSGAPVVVHNLDLSKGTPDAPIFSGVTPCELKLWRNRAYYIEVYLEDKATATCKSYVVKVVPKVHWGAVGSSVLAVSSGFPGLIGLPIDAASGANMKPDQRFVFVDFSKVPITMKVVGRGKTP